MAPGKSPKRPEVTSDRWSPRTEASVWGVLALLAIGTVWFAVRAVEIDSALEASNQRLASARASDASAKAPAHDAADASRLTLAWTVGVPGKLAEPQASLRRAVEALLAARLPHGVPAGAAIRVLAETGEAPKQPSILALNVRPLGSPGDRFYRFSGSATGELVDESGREPAPNPWQAPLAKMRRTSPFNPKRMHPILHRVTPHEGTDYGAPSGTPVYAALEGTVSWVGPHGAHGNWVAIMHADGVETGYAHLSKFAAGLKRGDRVATHQIVGYVGSTGRSTGPHLHFSASRNGVYFDAETLLAAKLRELPVEQRDAFLAEKSELDRQLNEIRDPVPTASPLRAAEELTPSASDSTSQPRAAASGTRHPRR